MLARLHVLLPFSVQIPDKERFALYEYLDSGYRIRFYPPGRSEVPATAGDVSEIFINDRPAGSFNTLRIDFAAEEFDRKSGPESDPSQEFMSKTVNSFLARLRYVTRAASIRPIDFPRLPWKLRYLNDDETELEEKEGFVRGRGAITVSLNFIGLTKEIWSDIHELDSEFEEPKWHDFLLDAQDASPEIGPMVVLATAALEVFISQTLDELSARSSVPDELWDWIVRSNWRRAPSTEEQFDALLNTFLNYSLKHDPQLWEAFVNLRSAKNMFVHRGTACIGKNPITSQDAGQLLTRSWEIVRAIRDRLPEDLQWKEFEHELKVTAKWEIPRE